MCGSLGVNFRRPSSDVDERVKAFTDSAATVYQQQGSNVTGRRFSGETEIGLGLRRFIFGRGHRRVRRSPSSIRFALAPRTIVGRIEDVQCTFSNVRYEEPSRRISRATRFERRVRGPLFAFQAFRLISPIEAETNPFTLCTDRERPRGGQRTTRFETQ